jgi:N-acetyl-gamma-glutamyl-phosphate reductase
MNAKTQRAVIYGAGGFAGGELLRLLAVHPHFHIEAALSHTRAGERIGQVYPNLVPFTDAVFTSPEDWDFDALREGDWTLFAALGHGQTMTTLAPLVREVDNPAFKIVDLSGDFRLEDAGTYRQFYGLEHTAPELLGGFVYGLPELNRGAIKGARLVANPGCFATSAQLALLPVAATKRAVRFVAVDAKTGSSGGGIKPAATTHHPNRMNNFSAYKQLTHQHFPEIRGGWAGAGGPPDTEISFVPQRAPMVRGIFTTAHFFMDGEVSADEAAGWYRDYYEDHPFVRVVERSPFVSNIWGTNMCDVSVTAAGRTVVASAAIDNLIKGAAGQAVQNANLQCGFEETAGLLTPAPTPI